MKYFVVSNISKPLDSPDTLQGLAAGKLGVSPVEILDAIIVRQSLDARKKGRLKYVYTCAVKLDASHPISGLEEYVVPEIDLSAGTLSFKQRPVIIGLGPAGLFAAHTMVKKGYKPIILEQGKPVAERAQDVRLLCDTGIFNARSNVLFGEGGAGAFSDGKLTARNRSAVTDVIYRTFIEYGAIPETGYMAKPHIGTDKLTRIISAMTQSLTENGAEIFYNTQVSSFKPENGGTLRVMSDKGDWISDCVVCAPGYGARALFREMLKLNVTLEKKTFAIGFRVEHPRDFIDSSQYGESGISAVVGAADYHLTESMGNGRGIYTFCVCPGGEIINASAEEGMMAVNGMSLSMRNSPNTNSAVVVTVYPSDLPDHALAGVEFSEQIERACAQGPAMHAPVQRLKDFMRGVKSATAHSSYKPGCYCEDISGLMPNFIVKALHHGIHGFDRKIRGYIEQGVAVAPETGTSSPVRITRNPDTFESVSCKGWFPIGEGAGYSGGIVSSA
ncbi:MAG: hypothetical protein A2350_08745, partial [Candidatus Raymondbacteria bacterium RifOxyB12_full_50_8]